MEREDKISLLLYIELHIYCTLCDNKIIIRKNIFEGSPTELYTTKVEVGEPQPVGALKHEQLSLKHESI